MNRLSVNFWGEGFDGEQTHMCLILYSLSSLQPIINDFSGDSSERNAEHVEKINKINMYIFEPFGRDGMSLDCWNLNDTHIGHPISCLM